MIRIKCKTNNKTNIYIKISILTILLSLLFLYKGYGMESDKNVLFISSYSENLLVVPLQIEGIKSVLSENKINLHIEYMDTKRYETKENIVNFHSLLKYKLDNVKAYDAIIVGDDSALQFAIDYRDSLFKNIPIVFFGINDIGRAEFAKIYKNMTGIIEETSIEENIEIALRFNKNAKKVIAIVDNSLTGVGDRDQFLKCSNKFKNLKFGVINVSNYTIKELEDVLDNIQDDTILIYLSTFTDKTGKIVTIDEAVDILREHTHVPVYRTTIGGIGQGLLGGNLVSYTQMGEMAANIVLRILDGTPIESIDMVYDTPHMYLFDYNIIKKYNIDENSIPKEAVIINKKVNPLEQNKDAILTLILIISFLIIILTVLIIDNINRRAIQKALTDSNIKLAETYEELADSDEELRSQYDTIQWNIQQMKEQTEKIEYLAEHDYLTNLPNRMQFTNKLKEELISKKFGAVLLLDIDNFKSINDTLGHAYGDEVLKQISHRLKNLANEDLFVSRFGGDEFIIFIINVEKIDEINEYVNQIVNLFEESFKIDEVDNYIQFSIGITRFPYDSNNINQIIANADTAMYKAKNAGRNTSKIFSNDMKDELTNRAEIEYILRDSIKSNGFMLLYQPLVDAKTDKIVGFEALIRIKNQNIYPSTFISIAEENGLIIDIGRWVTKEAIEQLASWRDKGFELKPVSINFSSKQLRDIGYIEFLSKTLIENKIETKYVEIEITENILFKKTEKSLEFLNKLKDMGIKISLDDFGTGFSSLSYLTYIPVNKIKLDKSLCDKFLELNNVSVIENLISLAHSLKLEVTAEGIERIEQYKRLKFVGCNYIQGYLFSKPVCAEEIEKIYNSNLLGNIEL